MKIGPRNLHQLIWMKNEGENNFEGITIILFSPFPFRKLLFSSYYATLPSSNLFKLLQNFSVQHSAQPSFWKRKQMPQVKVFKQFLVVFIYTPWNNKKCESFHIQKRYVCVKQISFPNYMILNTMKTKRKKSIKMFDWNIMVLESPFKWWLRNLYQN